MNGKRKERRGKGKEGTQRGEKGRVGEQGKGLERKVAERRGKRR